MSIFASRLPALKFLAIFGALNYGATFLSKVHNINYLGYEKISYDNSRLSWFEDRLENPVHNNGSSKATIHKTSIRNK